MIIMYGNFLENGFVMSHRIFIHSRLSAVVVKVRLAGQIMCSFYYLIHCMR